MYATYERRWWTLTVLCLSLVLIILGNTVLNVALPSIQRDLGATATQLQWMVDAYALVFAGLLITAGALGDRFGRRGALQIGLAIFGLASVGATFATGPEHVIISRAVQGLGAALVMPGTLSILTNIFPPEERAKAIGIWAGLAGSGAAIGPVAGGWLVDHFSWSAPFWLNVGVVVLAMITGVLLIPSSRDPEQTPLDPMGAVLSIAGLSALLFAIIEAPNHGWLDPVTLAGFAAAALLLAVFGVLESKRTHPMLDLQFFRNPRFTTASAVIFVVFLCMFGAVFLLTQYLQFVRGYSALSAGIRCLPLAVPMMVVAPLSPKAVARFGIRRVIAFGMAVASVGIGVLSTVDVDSPYALLLVAFVVLGSGMSLVMPPATTAIMASLPLGKAGVGSAVNDTTRELGGALGVAILGSLLASQYSSSLRDVLAPFPASVRTAAETGVGGALQVASRLGGDAGARLASAAREAFTDAMSLGLMASSGVFLLAALAAFRYIPDHLDAHPRPTLLPEDAEVDGAVVAS
jgi:EmrB/QacA subfamily drug resistance transporter